MKHGIVLSILFVCIVCAGADTSSVRAAQGADPWADLGHALGGILPVEPHMIGTGPLTPSSETVLSLTDGVQGVFAFLVIGLSRIDAPHAGGTLVPAPDFIFRFITNDGDGSVVVSGRWPSGVPSGFTTYFQFWLQDGAGPFGFVASNAISGTTP